MTNTQDARSTHHRKDHFLVIWPDPHTGLIVVGDRAVTIPANIGRVYSLAAGFEYGSIVFEWKDGEL